MATRWITIPSKPIGLTDFYLFPRENLPMRAMLLTLAEVSFRFGVIGIDEYDERCRVAFWLADGDGKFPDPRSAAEAESDAGAESVDGVPHGPAAEITSRASQNPKQPDWLEFLYNGWVFTKGDPDPYPSVPHGHWQSANNKLPKLNPYTGRVFMEKHQEDVSRRLKKRDLRILWGHENFTAFCGSHLIWYRAQYPYHKFPVSDDHMLRFPKWR